jgi:hypothetical protein
VHIHAPNSAEDHDSTVFSLQDCNNLVTLSNSAAAAALPSWEAVTLSNTGAAAVLPVWEAVALDPTFRTADTCTDGVGTDGIGDAEKGFGSGLPAPGLVIGPEAVTAFSAVGIATGVRVVGVAAGMPLAGARAEPCGGESDLLTADILAASALGGHTGFGGTNACCSDFCVGALPIPMAVVTVAVAGARVCGFVGTWDVCWPCVALLPGGAIA